MSTDTNPSTKGERKPGPGRLPPDEKFWQRYSPHQEAPLSAVTSFGVHALVIGGLILLAYLGWLGFGSTSKAIPVEAVNFERSGGGGSPNGKGNTKGSNPGLDTVETTDPNPEPFVPQLDERVQLPTSVIDAAPAAVQSDESFTRLVKAGNPNTKIFQQLKGDVLAKLRDGLNSPKGRRGEGSGGGSGNGEGTGDGNDKGDRKGKLTNREKRMLRWTMMFNTHAPGDYLLQLRSLGAILAIPTGTDNKNYKIIRDLSGRGTPKLLDEDISTIQCIFWVDDRPQSVESLSRALHLSPVPGHIVAFMPAALEQQLFELEKKEAKCPEDEIFETRFEVIAMGRGKYQPRVVSVTRHSGR